jgi:hypothetical protein
MSKKADPPVIPNHVGCVRTQAWSTMCSIGTAHVHLLHLWEAYLCLHEHHLRVAYRTLLITLEQDKQLIARAFAFCGPWK